MKGRKRMETSCHFLLLMVVSCCPSFVHAQGATSQFENPATTTKNTSELLATLDHLVEQNRRLEKQNQELMNQKNSLRQFLAKQSGAATDAIPKETGIANPAVAATAPNHIEEAKSPSDVLPKASEHDHSASSTFAQSSVNEGQQGAQANPDAPSGQEYGRNTTWNLYEPGKGFDIAKSKYGSLNFSGYLVARYLNQVTLWTVNDTAQVAIVGTPYYALNKHFPFGVGWNGFPGTRSMQGSHPYWPSYDHVMADEFFRPYFTQAFFAEGDLGHRFSFKFTIGNNLSNLDISAVTLTRDLSKGVSLTWMPTTGEFGPRGAFGETSIAHR